MDTANPAMLERRSFWQDHLTQWQASGLTQVAYCRQHGVNLAQFGYWKKRLLPVRSPNTEDGRTVVDVLVRYNKRTASVLTEDGHRWNVSPRFLRRVEPRDITPAADRIPLKK